MALSTFGKSLYPTHEKKKISIKWNTNSSTKGYANEPTLIELAEERFGKDRKLIMFLQMYLDMRTKERQRPSRVSWLMQLQLLEKFPKEARVKQVEDSIRNGYRSIAYESKLKNYTTSEAQEVKRELQDESDIDYSKGF